MMTVLVLVPQHKTVPGMPHSEPEALIPICKASRQVVLVGDHCQLPPVIQSQQAAQQGLQVSLFDRLIQAGVPSAMLQVGSGSCVPFMLSS